MNSSTLPSIPFTSNVDFYYTGNDVYGCKIFSDTVNFSSNPAAPTPVITVSGNDLSVASYTNIQWHQNGNPLVGETGTNYTMIPPAIYDIYVSYTSPDGCVAYSDTLNSTASIFTKNFEFGIYPNPTNGKVQIESSEEILTIQLLDLNGKLLVETSDKHLDLSNLTNGIYLVEIQTISRLFKSKIIKSE
jgi:hypothetical protein